MRFHIALLLLSPSALTAACATDTGPGPDPASEVLRIPVPDSPTAEGWTVWQPVDRQADPRAGDPAYVYLEIGVDAVELPGPDVAITADDDDLLTPADASASWTIDDESYAGLTVVVNDRLRYRFEIDDFEDEVSPIWVDLRRTGDVIESRFVFAADGAEGVAHEAVARAIVDDVETAQTTPWSLEARVAP